VRDIVLVWSGDEGSVGSSIKSVNTPCATKLEYAQRAF
jgi:hypothetical protein